jgi:hypothetical protein
MVLVRLCASICVLLFAATMSPAAASPPGDPIYVRIDNGWKGLYGIDDEYAEYSFKGSEAKLQDPYHILLRPSLGVMVTFADKRGFASGDDAMEAYLQRELRYWRQRSSNVESSPRGDLSGGRSDLRVTEIRLSNAQGGRMTVYVLTLAASQGVFVLAISPADPSIDAQIRDIATSFKLVHRKLDPDEVKRISMEERAK